MWRSSYSRFVSKTRNSLTPCKLNHPRALCGSFVPTNGIHSTADAKSNESKGPLIKDASNPRMFERILVANRGEIACRVMRTASRLGIRTVAVYSDADANAQHVLQADEAYNIGPPAARDSYLRMDHILDVAKRTGAQGIHPGYGFLSENSEFAKACSSENITFIGPPVGAIEAMGSKSASKDIMINANVPVTPGYHGEDQSMDKLRAEAEKIGYPVMIKAVMGGGGKGMRICWSADEFESSVESCQREARASFGDDRVLLERYLTTPRHIELQVFADTFGDAVYLFERDCSVQRRHQKVLEEAPAPQMTPELRSKMGDAAVAAAKAVGYVGAGTVEFMVDFDQKNIADSDFFFMEMNTRLQVEHPVTELITGQDLVEWQLRVASGERLPLRQEELSISGHAIEARVYAENPLNNFLPATGTLEHLVAPVDKPGIRVDTGVVQGDSVSIHYDPMISKLIAYGEDRDTALRRLREAIKGYEVVGLPNNLDFLQHCAAHPMFVEGGVDTSFLNKHLEEVLPPRHTVPPRAIALAAFSKYLRAQAESAEQATRNQDAFSPWSAGDSSRPIGNDMVFGCAFTDENLSHQEEQNKKTKKGTKRDKKNAKDSARPKGSASGNVHVTIRTIDSNSPADQPIYTSGDVSYTGLGPKGALYEVRVAIGVDATAEVGEESNAKEIHTYRVRGALTDQPDTVFTVIDGTKVMARVIETKRSMAVFTDGVSLQDQPADTDVESSVKARGADPSKYILSLPTFNFESEAATNSAPQVITPMPGKVVKVFVKEGEEVKDAQPVMIIEAMKMEHIIKAPVSGKVAKIRFGEGAQVGDSEVLAVFEPPTED